MAEILRQTERPVLTPQFMHFLLGRFLAQKFPQPHVESSFTFLGTFQVGHSGEHSKLISGHECHSTGIESSLVLQLL